MPMTGWVVDLGANRGLFAVWAAVSGAQAVAVEAQQGFGPLIQDLARHNDVARSVHVETALASGVSVSGAGVGLLGDAQRWSTSSHGARSRPCDVTIPQIMAKYAIERIGLLKADIEGAEFAVLGPGEDLRWLQRVDQIALEVHPEFGDVSSLIDRLQCSGFRADLRDNDGSSVGPTSQQINYVYCQRL